MPPDRVRRRELVGMLAIFLVTVFLVANAGRATAQSPVTSSVTAQGVVTAANTAERFEREQPGPWRVQWNEGGRNVRSIAGSATEPFSGSSREAAVAFLEAYGAMLIPDVVPTDGMSSAVAHVGEQATPAGVRETFQQTYAGIPVALGFVDVLVQPSGRIVAATSSAIELHDVDVTPELDADDAAAKLAGLLRDQGSFTLTNTPQLVIWSGNEARLAYEIVGWVKRPGNVARFFVDADTGELLQTQSLVVEPKPTNAPLPDETLEANPELDVSIDPQHEGTKPLRSGPVPVGVLPSTEKTLDYGASPEAQEKREALR